MLLEQQGKEMKKRLVREEAEKQREPKLLFTLLLVLLFVSSGGLDTVPFAQTVQRQRMT
jgi:hypothetical protein